MAYYTYSQGFRPGGFNRTDSINGQRGSASRRSRMHMSRRSQTCVGNSDQFDKPAGYESDNLINNEVGFKSEFFDTACMVNVSALPDGLEERAAAAVRSGAPGQHDLRRQRPDLHASRASSCSWSPDHGGLTHPGIELVEQLRADQRALPAQWASIRTMRIRPTIRPRMGQCITQIKARPYTNPYGVLGHAAGVLAAMDVQPARAVRLDARATTSPSPGSAPTTSAAEQRAARASRTATIAAVSQSADHDAAAVRDPGLHDL